MTPACTSTAQQPCLPDDGTVARVWNEATLDAIRRDFPAPTVHARNLFHLSAAMWDVWAAYDPEATGYFVDEDLTSRSPNQDRAVAISYAAYRVLRSRYATAAGAVDTLRELDDTMADLCLAVDDTGADGDSPAALGNRIAAAVLEHGRTDGSNELDAYVGEYVSVNPPLVVSEPGTEMTDPNRWQPLSLEEAIAQNGLPIASGVQAYVGPHWGRVTPFALDPAPDGLPIDPGAPPYLGDPASDAAFRAAVVEVIEASSRLDPAASDLIDISPGALGNNPLGTDAGSGYDANPATGAPYAPNLVPAADFGRVLAEFWADGPASETPPGHWNTIANWAGDQISDLRIGGTGEPVDRLEWDVKLYFVLNGALHDAAIAAWGAKAHYDYARPISMIRYMGGAGQSTDPQLPSYDPEGLPLVAGLVEVITEQSSAAGERHDHLADSVGDIAIRAWQGPPEDADIEVGGVGWIRAVDWLPYQQATFVTPSFPGYVSGHSTFSRAAADVLAAFTGDPFFPGGLAEWELPAGWLEFEAGPESRITLQWARYADAADQAGRSRIHGGIHVSVDDLAGRIMGAECATAAWSLAQRYFSES